MPLFSIIIPVYNVEKFINKCIDSILIQTYTDYELILVNDGSKDNSLEICLEYQKNNNRIKVINKENGGASSARNEGINNSSGDYTIFIDSDDYIESPNFLEKIKLRINQNNADLILFSSKDYNVNSGSTSISRGNYNYEIINKFNLIETLNYLIESDLFPGAAWIFATKSSIINKHRIFFKTDIIAEDIDWITNLLLKIETIDAVNNVYHIYRKNQENSVTGTAGYKGIQSVLGIIEEWKPKLESELNPINLILLHNLAYYYFTSLVLYSKINKSQKNALKVKMKEGFEVTKYVKTKKLKLMRLVFNSIGLNFTSMLLNKLYSLK